MLARYFTLARGWNRQADLQRNPLFYDEAGPPAAAYETWLQRWTVSYVVVPPGPIDPASRSEAALGQRGLAYLTEVWSDQGWGVYRVREPTPLVAAPGRIPEGGVHPAPRARPGRTRIINRHGCVRPDPEPGAIDGLGPTADVWTILRVRRAGGYTLVAPYADSPGAVSAR